MNASTNLFCFQPVNREQQDGDGDTSGMPQKFSFNSLEKLKNQQMSRFYQL